MRCSRDARPVRSRSRRGGARSRSPCGFRARSAGRPCRSACIMRSRMTLATIEAAAIDCERWSPLTSAWQSQGRPGGTSRPSASASRARDAAGRKRAPHRLEARLAGCRCGRCLRPSTEAIRDAERLLQDDLEQRLALRRGQPLGIVEPLGNALGVEDDGRRDHRAGERSAAGLVEPGDRPQPVASIASPLEREVGFWSSSKRGGESERGRAMLRRCSHRLRFSARPSRPLGGGPGRHRRQPGDGAGRIFVQARAGVAAAAAAAAIQSSISCSLFLSAGTNRSVRSGVRFGS